MPPRKKTVSEIAGGDSSIEQAGVAAIGHNNPPVSDNDLIAENFALEDAIAAAMTKFNEWAKPKKTRIAEIENEIQRRLIERGADSTRTDAGTAYINHLMSTKVEDNGSLFDWVADHWADAGGEAKINIKLETVKNYMEANNGHPPPGMSVSYYSRLNIKRS